MNRKEHLLTITAEECSEVAKECSKSLRFGLDDKLTLDPYGERGTEGKTNAEKLMEEFHQLEAMIEMMQVEGILPPTYETQRRNIILDKKAKVQAFLHYSKRTGCLESENEA